MTQEGHGDIKYTLNTPVCSNYAQLPAKEQTITDFGPVLPVALLTHTFQ
jgi:hypothetical protein